MNYEKTRWTHSNPRNPVWIYHELDEERWETRKVEIFPDGSRGHASTLLVDNGQTGLSEKALPTPSECAEFIDQGIEITEITKEEFEEVWKATVGG